MSRFASCTLCATLTLLASCKGGTSGGNQGLALALLGSASGGAPEMIGLRISGSPETNGIYDPAPSANNIGSLWMSHSIVQFSSNDANLYQVHTRIASSTDAGVTWTDIGVDPNYVLPDFQVDDGKGGKTWATFQFEVSRLLYDSTDADANRRWKILWHRYIAVDINGKTTRTPENGWIGLSTAPAPDGPWASERKLFTGSIYNSALDTIIGSPEHPLAATYPNSTDLGNCLAFTEPGLLARPDYIYVSLVCATGLASTGKVVLLGCDRTFFSCTYIGDLLSNGEASQFSLPARSLTGFSASELVESGGNVFLIVSGYEPPDDTYRGCLVFHVTDLATATIERSAGVPVLVKRVEGTPGSVNGACGYDPNATGSGVLYSQHSSSRPSYRVFESHIQLP